jgi:hypothetical protein
MSGFLRATTVTEDADRGYQVAHSTDVRDSAEAGIVEIFILFLYFKF